METPAGQSGLVKEKDSPVKSPLGKKERRSHVMHSEIDRRKMERSARRAEAQGPWWAGSTARSGLASPQRPCAVLDPLMVRTISACQEDF